MFQVTILGLFVSLASGSVLSPLLSSPYNVPASALAKIDSARKIFVNCANGSDAASGTNPSTALKTLAQAVSVESSWIEVSGGLCPLSSPVLVDKPMVIHGDGKTAISGGRAIESWKPSPLHPGGKVMVANVATFPLKEIKKCGRKSGILSIRLKQLNF